MKKSDGGLLFDSIQEVEVIEKLKLLEASKAHRTKPFFRGSSPRWTDNYISFVEYHLNYLKSHPTLNPDHYISNLYLILRKTQR